MVNRYDGVASETQSPHIIMCCLNTAHALELSVLFWIPLSLIWVTGYGDRTMPPGTLPPFDSRNVVLITDGTCASACTIVYERFTNGHSVPTITLGRRPLTGPMQAAGSTKDSTAWPNGGLDSPLPRMLKTYLNDTISGVDHSTIVGTVSEDWNNFAL